jgi:hypothetical protein
MVLLLHPNELLQQVWLLLVELHQQKQWSLPLTLQSGPFDQSVKKLDINDFQTKYHTHFLINILILLANID